MLKMLLQGYSAPLSLTDILILVFVGLVILAGGIILWKFLKGGGDNW